MNAYKTVYAPSTGNDTPVTYVDSSLTRQRRLYGTFIAGDVGNDGAGRFSMK